MIFLYIPYGTDAPLYRLPIITIVMIVINIAVFAMFTGEQVEPYMLAMGTGLYPVQWLTANFLHADFFHLLFNMLFLWVFGPVIEGRMGAFRMLAIYLGIAIVFGAVFQILTLGLEPGFALGASGVIFGLAAMSFIWAPESKVHGYVIFWFFRYGFVKDTETEISIIVGFFAVLQVLGSLLLGNNLLGELGHILGAILGLAVAIGLLKLKFVDCEYQDIFSVWSGAKERAEIEAKDENAIQRRERGLQKRQKRQNLLSEEIKLAIEHQTPLPAFVIAQRTEREFADWTLPQELHLKMIQQLLAGKHWTEATASMRHYLERHQEQASSIRIMLVQALLVQNKPSAAMKVLGSIPLQEMGAEQQSAISKIRKKAEAMHQKNLEEGVYEMDEVA